MGKLVNYMTHISRINIDTTFSSIYFKEQINTLY